MIKISHEVPLSLLEESLNFNDYEYILPYFYYRYTAYGDFMRKCRDQNRFSILDNGLFEGETYTNLQLVDLICQLSPSVFIVPDEWNNWRKTYENAEEWMKINQSLRLPSDLMVVLQGNSFSELIDCFKLSYNIGYRYFGINHSSAAYGESVFNKTVGRINFIEYLNEWVKDLTAYDLNECHFHLLGCNLPQEFSLIDYEKYPFIKTVDTSNPIILGLENQLYNTLGQIEKPPLKMEHYFEWPLRLENPLGDGKEIGKLELDTILKNVKSFRRSVNSRPGVEDSIKSKINPAPMRTAYEYLGFPIGRGTGLDLFKEAKDKGIYLEMKKVESRNYNGEVVSYPVPFLDHCISLEGLRAVNKSLVTK